MSVIGRKRPSTQLVFCKLFHGMIIERTIMSWSFFFPANSSPRSWRSFPDLPIA